MRVGIVTSHMSFDHHGGANYSRHVVAEQLEAAGHDVTIYTLNFSDENHVPVEHAYDLTETRIDSRTLFDGVAIFWKRMGRYFEENDIIHAYVPGVIPLLALYKTAHQEETPLVATLNGYTPFCTNTARMSDGCWADCTLRKKIRHARQSPKDGPSLGEVARMVFNQTSTIRLMNQFDRFFCLSPAVAKIYADVGVERDLLDVCPNMADPDFAADSTSTATERVPRLADGGTEEVTILYVGRLEPVKGISTLLAAVEEMRSTNIHVELVGDEILGRGKGLDGYAAEAKRRGIDDRVTFHGWVDYTELSPYYQQADLFVHPGKWPEPFGRTILEAMQHRLPVVCSDTGAPPWVSGSAGVSFPKDSPTALAAQLDTLVQDDDRREKMSAFTQVELERFEPDLVTQQLLDTYEEVLCS